MLVIRAKKNISFTVGDSVVFVEIERNNRIKIVVDCSKDVKVDWNKEKKENE